MLDVLKYLSNLLNENDTIVTAISGGPDSMCLLDILKKVRNNKQLKIVVAHVNHNVRIESYDEYEKVKQYCIDNDMIFEGMKIEKYTKDNFHDYARTVRYKFFEQLINKYGAKYLMTAHHGDDLIETVLMRIVRGSNINGYSGFVKEKELDNYCLVRPLIEKTKKEIQDYMDNNNLWYAIDKSNLKDVYTRNRYRKYILPKLKEEDKNVHKKFLKFSNKINDVSNFLEKYTDRKYKRIISLNKIDIKLLKREEKVIIDNILSRYLKYYYKNDIYLINDANTTSIYNCIMSNKSNMVIDIPGDFKFVKAYNYAYIINSSEIVKYKYEIKDEVKLEFGTIKVVDDSSETDNNIIYLNSKDIKLPLYVRSRKNGDRMCVKNMQEKKKVKSIFIDSKIPINDRDKYPIVVDSNDEILWIPGLKKSKFDSKNTQSYDIILKYDLRKELL